MANGNFMLILAVITEAGLGVRRPIAIFVNQLVRHEAALEHTPC